MPEQSLYFPQPKSKPRVIEGVLSMSKFAFYFFTLVIVVVALGSITAHAQSVTSFEGIDASQVPHPETDVDPNGAVGTKQFMEWTNVYYQAFDKVTFAPVWSTPQPGLTTFTANWLIPCNNFNGGDVVIIFDRLASRWVLAAHTPGPTYYYCVAVSNTDDLTSTGLKWYTYAFPINSYLGKNSEGVTYYPDWPKIGTWPDAYYLSIDLGDENAGYVDAGVVACALDRNNMLVGATANTPQCFSAPTPVVGATDYLAHSLEPADVEGTTPPPVGAPEYFASIQNPVVDGVTTTSDTFNLWQFHVDWTNPANSTFTQNSISVPVYTPGCYSTSSPGNTMCVPEPSTAGDGQHIDSVGDRMMFRLAYRNFGDYQSYLLSHTVQAGAGVRTQTAIRWYELRGNGIPAVYQSGTISPDKTIFRFMPSIAQDQSGNAAVGYSVSSSSIHPGMNASWWNLQSHTTPTEITLYAGTGDEENAYNWGDYSSMTVDPVGECAFWYVNEYFTANQTGTETIWKTRISTFSVPSCGETNLTLSPGSVKFGNQAFGTTSGKSSITITNQGSTPITFSSIAVTGDNRASFPESTNCSRTLNAGANCTVYVSFAPATTGSFTAAVTITSSAPGSPQSVPLSGTGIPPVVIVPASVAYGNVVIGTSKAAVPFVLTNQMNVALTGINIVVNGAAFSQVNSCGTVLTPNTQCKITATFSPTVVGTATGSISITDSAANSRQSISRRGPGVLPVSLLPASLAFGTVSVGSSSAAKVTTVTNNEKVAVTISNIQITGTRPGDYSETNTCGSSLAAGGKCTISVVFKPLAKGARPASITLTDSGTNSPQVLPLAGTGD